MNLERWVDPRVRGVRVDSARQYLLDRGWQPRPFPRPQVLVFEGLRDDNGEPIVQWLPASEEGSDYERMMVRLITNLSVLEDRHPVEVLNDILHYQAAEPAAEKTGRDSAPASAALAGKGMAP